MEVGLKGMCFLSVVWILGDNSEVISISADSDMCSRGLLEGRMGWLRDLCVDVIFHLVVWTNLPDMKFGSHVLEDMCIFVSRILWR